MTAALSPRRLSVDQSAAIVPGKEDPVAHGGAQVDEDRLDLTVLGHLRTSVLLRWLFVIVRNHHHPEGFALLYSDSWRGTGHPAHRSRDWMPAQSLPIPPVDPRLATDMGGPESGHPTRVEDWPAWRIWASDRLAHVGARPSRASAGAQPAPEAAKGTDLMPRSEALTKGKAARLPQERRSIASDR